MPVEPNFSLTPPPYPNSQPEPERKGGRGSKRQKKWIQRVFWRVFFDSNTCILDMYSACIQLVYSLCIRESYLNSIWIVFANCILQCSSASPPRIIAQEHFALRRQIHVFFAYLNVGRIHCIQRICILMYSYVFDVFWKYIRIHLNT